MIIVKLFGVARLKSGVREFKADIHTIDELRHSVPGMTQKEVRDLVILVNGKSVGRYHQLKDGDEVVLLSPAGGG